MNGAGQTTGLLMAASESAVVIAVVIVEVGFGRFVGGKIVGVTILVVLIVAG